MCVWDSHQPPSSKKKFLEHKSTKQHTTPELLLFFYAVLCYDVRYGAALAARVLWGHKKEFFDLLISHIQAQKTFFELPFKAHLQALRGI